MFFKSTNLLPSSECISFKWDAYITQRFDIARAITPGASCDLAYKVNLISLPLFRIKYIK